MEFKYRGLRARLEHVDVTDEEVTRQLVRLQQQSQRRTPVFDRPSQNGDELVLDYAGFADGQQFAGGTAEKQTLVLGSVTFIPGFEEQLVGKNPGDDVTVHVTFPAQYHAPELAGKDAEFRCRIHEIRTVAPYALDDTFAKEVGECETMDEMRQKMRTSLEDYYAERAEMELRERLLRQAAASMDFTPDPAEISKAVEEQLDTMSAQLAQKNLTLEDYCKFTNSTLDQMREDARPGAEQAVRIKALVRKVAQLEDLHAAEEDVAQALSEICRANHMTMEELQPYYDDAFAAAVEYRHPAGQGHKAHPHQRRSGRLTPSQGSPPRGRFPLSGGNVPKGQRGRDAGSAQPRLRGCRRFAIKPKPQIQFAVWKGRNEHKG